MADDEKKKGPSDEGARNIAEVILIIFILFAFLSGPVKNFSISSFLSDSSPLSFLNLSQPLSSLVGDSDLSPSNPVSFKEGSPLLDTPGGQQIMTVSPEDKATIIGGPVVKDGTRYWQVELEDGTRGYIAEDFLTGPNGEEFDPGNTLIGESVEASRNTSVYDHPGGRQIGVIEKGTSGIIVGGPEIYDGGRYWLVEFEDGTIGYVSENNLRTQGNQTFAKIVVSLKFISYILSVLFLTGIIYCSIRISQLHSVEAHKYSLAKPGIVPIEDKVDPRWKRITDHLDSDNPSDWRLAILEADIVLDEMLKRMGYHGETIGDRLKSVEKSDFTTIDLAWEAHKVRNLIAHEGSDYLITQREAKRIIKLYEKVFEEFHMDTRE